MDDEVYMLVSINCDDCGREIAFHGIYSSVEIARSVATYCWRGTCGAMQIIPLEKNLLRVDSQMKKAPPEDKRPLLVSLVPKNDGIECGIEADMRCLRWR